MENKLLNISEADLQTMYASTFTKKDAKEAGKNLVQKIFESGEYDELKIYSNIVRLKEVVNSIDSEFREKLNLSNEESCYGVTFTPKAGAKKLQYEDDPDYLELKQKLKEREQLIKTATNSKDVIFDSNGVEVPKVSVKYDKSSITIKF